MQAGPDRRARRRASRLPRVSGRASAGGRSGFHLVPRARAAAALRRRGRDDETILAGHRGEGRRRRAVRRRRVRQREVRAQDPGGRAPGGAGDHPLSASGSEQGPLRGHQARRRGPQERIAGELPEDGRGRGGLRREHGDHRQSPDRVEAHGGGDRKRERRVHHPGPLMLQEDPKRTHVPAEPQLIVALYVATNQPVVQPVGRTAQAAQGAVVAVREGAVFHVMVALTLAESGENVIYSAPPVEQREGQQALEEALNFAESMGFILDGTGWANLDDAHRAELLERTPAFWPPAHVEEAAGPADVEEEAAEKPKTDDPMQAVARLFAAFAPLLFPSSSGVSAEQRAPAAEVPQQLGDKPLYPGDAAG